MKLKGVAALVIAVGFGLGGCSQSATGSSSSRSSEDSAEVASIPIDGTWKSNNVNTDPYISSENVIISKDTIFSGKYNIPLTFSHHTDKYQVINNSSQVVSVSADIYELVKPGNPLVGGGNHVCPQFDEQGHETNRTIKWVVAYKDLNALPGDNYLDLDFIATTPDGQPQPDSCNSFSLQQSSEVALVDRSGGASTNDSSKDPSPDASAAPASGRPNGAPDVHPNENYLRARASLIGWGLKPAPIPRGGEYDGCGLAGEGAACKRFPELVGCSGMGSSSGTCRMVFVAPDGKFVVVSTYGWEEIKSMVFTGMAWANADDSKRVQNIISGKPELGD